MADNFMPMGAVPDFYGPIMRAAASSLVKMPDGTLRAAPHEGGPTSVGQLYAGMYQPQPATAHGVASVTRADPVGSLTASGGWNQFDDQFNQPATLAPKPQATIRMAAAPGSTINAVNPLDISRLGLTSDPFRTAAEQAVTAEAAGVPVTVHGGNAFSGAKAAGHASIGGLIFAPAVTGTGPEWSTADRQFSPPRPQTGLVTGARPVNMPMMAATGQPQMVAAPAAMPIMASSISPEVHAALMAQQSADQRGQAASQASGQLNSFGMLTGSGGHGDPAH